MVAVSDWLTAREAAIISGVRLRDVNRAMDEGILPEAFVQLDDGRRIMAGAGALLAFYFESAPVLTSEERLSVIRVVAPRFAPSRVLLWGALLREDWILRRGFLTVDLRPFVESVGRRLDDLAAAREMVGSSSDILGGMSVIMGTRIPVHDVAALVAARHSTAHILEAWPSLDAQKIRLAAIYAAANPPRGRPRRGSRLPLGAVIVVDRRVAPVGKVVRSPRSR